MDVSMSTSVARWYHGSCEHCFYLGMAETLFELKRHNIRFWVQRGSLVKGVGKVMKGKSVNNDLLKHFNESYQASGSSSTSSTLSN